VQAEGFEKALQYTFQDKQLLLQALTHPSYGEGDNQRLEFLGDAVLELCVSRLLYTHEPDLREGGLTHRRALLVREATLARAARELSLGQYLRMDRGEENTGGRDKDSILADALEAVLAAVFLDSDLTRAMAVVQRILPQTLAHTPLQADAKSALQELLQGRGEPAPTYETILEEGPPHMRHFTVAVCLADGQTYEGAGKSKKLAEQEAAQAALNAITHGGGEA